MSSGGPLSARSIAELVEGGRSEQALLDARQFVEQAPMEPAAWRALGYVQVALNRLQEGEQSLLHAISLAPKDAMSWEHLGWLYRRSGDFARAVSALQESLAIDGAKTRPRMMLANSLADLGKAREAIVEYQRVLEQEPDHVRAHNNLANLLVERGDLKSATGHYLRAAEHSNELTYRISAAHAARRIGDWATAERLEQSLLRSMRAGERPHDRTQPFPIVAMPSASAADQLRAARQMARAYAGVEAVPHKPAALLSAQGRLRIGYVSSDLHDHATTHLLVEALELHDRRRFEIVGFDFSANRASGYRSRILKAFDRVVSIVEFSELNAARRIAAEDIAIAIDLKGWTTGARPQILARRPAPLTAQWLGHPGTMGAPWIDYAIVDPVVAPPGSEAEFSEKLLRLPHCYQPNDRRRTIAEPPTRAEAGLPENAFVYCSFNQPFKINRAVFGLWLDLLRAVPSAVLWLKDDNDSANTALKEHAQHSGIDPARLIFGRSLPVAEHLARLRLADLALDCHPCGSHTTASDALWAGVPLIAYRGNTFAARVSASVLTAAGLPELIVPSDAEYRDLAIRLATDRAMLAQLRARLAANRQAAPLFDSPRFARQLEAGYEAIWRRCASGLPPDHTNIT